MRSNSNEWVLFQSAKLAAAASTIAALAGCGELRDTGSYKGTADQDVQAIRSELTNPQPNASGDPQLFGFGFAQIGVLSSSRLQVLAPPARVQDTPWTTRWTTALGSPQAVVFGDFWHDTNQPDSKAYLAVIASGRLTVYDPIEVPSAQPWKAISAPQTLPGLPGTGVLDYAAGDLLGQNRDQLLVLTSSKILIYTAPSSPTGAWTLSRNTNRPASASGIAAGEFLSGISNNEEDRYRSNYIRDRTEPDLYGQGIGRGPRGLDELCLLKSDGHLAFYGFNAAASSWTLRRTDSRVVSGKIAAGDFVKRGRDAIAVVSDRIRVYESPTTATGQSTLLITGSFDAAPGTILDVTADRMFGYVDKFVNAGSRRGTPNPDNATPGKGDLEIAFVERTPRYMRSDPATNRFPADGHYGWPLKGETVTYTVYVKNNAATTISAGAATVKLWLNRPQRNADILSPSTPDQVLPINVAIPPFDPNSPRYVTVQAQFAWPYDLVVENNNAFKKLSLSTLGERWVIAGLDFAGDFDLRNNRYEAALHSWLLHPVYRGAPTLSDTQPTVAGDPYSIEYETRKLGEALSTMWARSHTGDKMGADIRVTFDGYLLEPDDANPDYVNRWHLWEGPRDLTTWFGDSWEIFNFWGVGDEHHETMHLFHQLGDLYQYFVEPATTWGAKMADQRPVQIFTNVWGHDDFSDNSVVIGEPGTMIHQHLAGMRSVGGDVNGEQLGHAAWWRISPARINVKVVSRTGAPVPNAQVALWSETDLSPLSTGTTDATGVWYTGYPRGTPVLDAFFNEPHYEDLPTTMFVTVSVGSYTDAAVLGADDKWAHSRYTLLARYHQDPNQYTWTFKTSYAPGASAFSPSTTTAVESGKVKIQVDAGGTFNLYRRRPPAYEKVLISTKAGAGSTVFTDDMADDDAFFGGADRAIYKIRAIYEVTEGAGSSESLPKQITLHSTNAGVGITDLGEGNLLVAQNSGSASPFVSLFNGATPEREYLAHFRFGHTAMKVVPSIITPNRFYMTLAVVDEFWESEFGGEHMFEVYDPGLIPSLGPQTTAEDPFFRTNADSVSATQIFANGVDLLASGVNLGDRVQCQDREVVITAVTAHTLTVGTPVFTPAGGTSFGVVQRAGAPGTNLQARQLASVRGLATLRDAAGAEYIAIADPVGGRIVVWDSHTTYKATFTAGAFVPTGIATHPTATDTLFVVDRSNSIIRRVRFTGGNLVDVGSLSLSTQVSTADPLEVGLATVAAGTDVYVAVTDAVGGRVLEYKLTKFNAFGLVQTFTQAQDPVVSTTALVRPLDVAYSVEAGVRHLYAADNQNRVVRIY